MRNLKFRIWDKQLKGFLYQLPEKHHLEWERFDVQQFTGLEDKNKSLIYEGDILLQKSTHISREVFWNEKRGCFSVTDRVKPHKHKVADYCHGAEIIGNIYEGLHSGENPELLSN